MLGFNIDFLTHNLKGKRPLTRRSGSENVKEFIEHVQIVQKKVNRIALRKAFSAILQKKKLRVKGLCFLEVIFQHQLRSVWTQILRFSLKNKRQVISNDKKMSFPIALLQKTFGEIVRKSKSNIFVLLRKNLLESRKKYNHLCIVVDILKELFNRNISRNFFRGLSSYSIKAVEYANHLKGFQYLFQTIRVKRLFDTFTMMSVKTISRNLVELQKQRQIKRDQSRVSQIKKSEIANELKRKITNMIGQVNEAQINNNRRLVNGSRENGLKLMKINQQMRSYQINTSYMEFDIEKMQKQISRKEYYIASRADSQITLEDIQNIYHYLEDLNEFESKGGEVYSKVVAGNSISEIQANLNFSVMENIKLKHLMNMYQKIGVSKKTDSYTNADIENDSLKMLISSLLKSGFMSNRPETMMLIANEVNEGVTILLEERANINNS